MKLLSTIVGLCILATAFARDAYVCEVVLHDFCNNGDTTCATDPTLTFNGNAYGLSHFNLVTFGNFFAKSGDIEGRAAIKGNMDVTSYSFGYQLRTAGASAWDTSLPYSIVVGGDAKWNGGAAYPDGSNFPWQGAKEYIYVGGDFSQASSYLQTGRKGSCPGNVGGCLDSQFNYAQGYYRALSKGFGALTSNTAFTLQTWGTIELSCNSYADSQYVLNLTPAQFSTINFWSVATSCNPKSGLIVNIAGTGNQVLFQGSTQTYFSNSKTLYNIVSQTANTPSAKVTVGVNGNLLAPDSNYNQPGQGVFIGNVIVANVQETLQMNYIYCAPPVTGGNNPGTGNLCPAFETNCAGLDLVLEGNTYSFRDLNAISFGDFNADTGDIEGRLAVQGNAHFGNGYSVGDKLQTGSGTMDRHLPYSLIVGKDLAWGTGALYPNGDGNPYPGQAENMFVGGTFTTNQTDLIARRSGGPCASAGCLDATFNAAKTCYTGYSNTIASQSDNVAHSIQWSGLTITCNDASATDYYVSITDTEFTQFTYTTTGNCNFQARWYINIRGTGNVDISGGSFPGVPGGITYNVVGCGRTVTVHDTALAGHFLAVCSVLNQPTAVITGKVVAGNIVASRQINKQNTCPQSTKVSIPIVPSVASVQSNYAQFTTPSLVKGDKIQHASVTNVYPNNGYGFDGPVTLEAHAVYYIEADSLDARTPSQPETDNSSASMVSMTIALILALIAIAF